MSEWLDLMLAEIARKKRAAAEAAGESARRSGEKKGPEESTNCQHGTRRADRTISGL